LRLLAGLPPTLGEQSGDHQRGERDGPHEHALVHGCPKNPASRGIRQIVLSQGGTRRCAPRALAFGSLVLVPKARGRSPLKPPSFAPRSNGRELLSPPVSLLL